MLRKPQFSPHTKYSCIKPEQICLGDEYSFSFNPEDQPIFDKWYNVKINGLKFFSEKNENVLVTLRFCEVRVQMEVSSKGRLHYHGYIRIENVPKFIIHDLAKLRHYGTYEIDIIKDKDIWRTYVDKQKHFMENYCKLNDMKYEINGYSEM